MRAGGVLGGDLIQAAQHIGVAVSRCVGTGALAVGCDARGAAGEQPADQERKVLEPPAPWG
jgi:hypothetical protein